MKNIAEKFGGFTDFLYLCNILKSGMQATRCSWSEGVSNTIKNTTKGMIELYLSKVTESVTNKRWICTTWPHTWRNTTRPSRRA